MTAPLNPHMQDGGRRAVCRCFQSTVWLKVKQENMNMKMSRSMRSMSQNNITYLSLTTKKETQNLTVDL